ARLFIKKPPGRTFCTAQSRHTRSWRPTSRADRNRAPIPDSLSSDEARGPCEPLNERSLLQPDERPRAWRLRVTRRRETILLIMTEELATTQPLRTSRASPNSAESRGLA